MNEISYFQWILIAAGGGVGVSGFGFIVRAMIDKKIHNALHREDGTSTYVPRPVCKDNHQAICDKLKIIHDDIKKIMAREK